MRYLELSKEGKVKTFKGDFPQVESLLKHKREKRLSRIVPRRKSLRVIWMMLRVFFERLGYNRGIEWLRGWKVDWVVVIKGREIAVFKNRREAIRYEKEYVIKEGLL